MPAGYFGAAMRLNFNVRTLCELTLLVVLLAYGW
jgi:hypothetical protein